MLETASTSRCFDVWIRRQVNDHTVGLDVNVWLGLKLLRVSAHRRHKVSIVYLAQIRYLPQLVHVRYLSNLVHVRYPSQLMRKLPHYTCADCTIVLGKQAKRGPEVAVGQPSVGVAVITRWDVV